MREILFRGKLFHKEDYMLYEKLYKDNKDTIDVFNNGFVYGSLVVIKDKYYICVGVAGVMINSLINNATATLIEVIPETVGGYTNLTDKNGKKIFEGDIVQYSTYDDFDCQSIVKFGEYKQDGSDGEYKASDCLGFYVEVDNFTCPDWCDNEPERFHDYLKQQSLTEIASQCEIIGNIYDNPELLEVIVGGIRMTNCEKLKNTSVEEKTMAAVVHCKDCIHNEVCPVWDDYNDEPCKVGDKVYKVIRSEHFGNHIQEMIVEKFGVFAHTNFEMIFGMENNWDAFFDKEEAEAKLKEINENE